MVLYVGEEAIRDLLHWDRLISTMETALAAFSLGQVLQPVRSMLTIEEGKRYLGIMPAVADDAMGAKLVSFYPGNAGTGVPTHLAIILLFRPDTGEPLAVMDGRLITEMRTAAVSAAVTKYLASPDSRVLALLGSGVQAHAHLQALSRVRRFFSGPRKRFSRPAFLEILEPVDRMQFEIAHFDALQDFQRNVDRNSSLAHSRPPFMLAGFILY